MIIIKVSCPEPTGLISFRINPNQNYELTMTRPGGTRDAHVTKGNNLDITIEHIYNFIKEFIGRPQWNAITSEMGTCINAGTETYFEIETMPKPSIVIHR